MSKDAPTVPRTEAVTGAMSAIIPFAAAAQFTLAAPYAWALWLAPARLGDPGALLVAILALTAFVPLPALGPDDLALAQFEHLPGRGAWVDEPLRMVATEAIYFALRALACFGKSLAALAPSPGGP